MTEVRSAWRGLRRSPWYAAALIGTIAISTTLAVTVFAVVDGALFKPLPYRDVDHVFGVSPQTPSNGGRSLGLASGSVPDVRAWREAVPEVTFGTFNFGGQRLIAGGSVDAAYVDEHLLDVLGREPLIGGFRPSDFGPRGSFSPVLISHGLWQRAFGGAADVVGRRITDRAAAGQPATGLEVVGVLPADFLFPSPTGTLTPELLIAMAPPTAAETANASGRFLYAVARVPGEVPVDDVERRLKEAAGRVARLYPAPTPGRAARVPYDRVRLVPIREALTVLNRDVFSAAFVAAAVLLLLACINLAGLVAARLQDRQQELAIRRAMGATTTDLLRLTGCEVALAIAPGAGIAVMLSTMLLGVVRALLPKYVLLKTPVVDSRVLAFCVLSSAVAVLLVTGWSVAGMRVRRELVTSSGGASRRQRTPGRVLLVAAQVAIGLVLVLVGTLFTVSLQRVWQEDAGVLTDHAFRVELTTWGRPQSVDTINSLVETLRNVPGVQALGGLQHPFLEQSFGGSDFDTPHGVDARGVESLPVTAGFLEAAGLVAVQGRLPTDAEMEAGAPVLAVSPRAAARYWPGQPPIGQQLTLKGRAFVVVGVVPEVRFRSLDTESEGEVYWPLAAEPRAFLANLYVRTQPGRENAVAAILQELRARFPDYQVLNVQTAAQSFGTGIRARRFQAWLFGSFGAAGLAIVGVGLFGLLAMTTARRTREVGIRLALGATPSRIVALLLREQSVPVMAGLAAGTVTSVWAARVVEAGLYRTAGNDFQAWTVACACIVGAAATGALVPALRASRIQPITTLRSE